MSPRHFARVFAAEISMTPARFVEVQRVEAARRRLEESSDGVETRRGDVRLRRRRGDAARVPANRARVADRLSQPVPIVTAEKRGMR